MAPTTFADLAATADPSLDRLALALAAEFGPVDVDGTLRTLDGLAADVEPAGEGPEAEVDALVAALAVRHGFAGMREGYDEPDNSMLHLVLQRRRGLPILLSVVYVEVARRAGIALAGFGLPGHYVCGHVGTSPPLLIDPFNGGARLRVDGAVRPWGAHETAMRMLNNLVAAFSRRGHVAGALRAAELRLALPAEDAVRAQCEHDLRALRARLN